MKQLHTVARIDTKLCYYCRQCSVMWFLLTLVLVSTVLNDTGSISIDYSKYLTNINVEFTTKSEESGLFQDSISPSGYGFMVAIVADSASAQAVCGASLIDDRHILTAGHCARHIQEAIDSGETIEAWIAPTNLHNFKGQRIPITAVIRHNDFKPRPVLHHDISVATLGHPVQVKEGITPICMGAGIYDNSDVTLIGFGNYDCYTLSSQLRRATGKSINSTMCKIAGHRGVLLSSQLCAKLVNSLNEKADQAPGDSGGPLFLQRRNQGYVQIGIVSYNYIKNGKPDSDGNPIDPCPNIEIPGTYTRVASYQDFIRENAPLATFCS